MCDKIYITIAKKTYERHKHALFYSIKQNNNLCLRLADSNGIIL